MHNIKLIMILLVGITIIFAILGSFKMLPTEVKVEGFDDSTLGCSGEVIPACYENVLNVADYKNDPSLDYILKTEVVVPTCPACPAYLDKRMDSLKNKQTDANNELINDSQGWSDSNWGNRGSDYKTESSQDGKAGQDGQNGLAGESGQYGQNGQNGLAGQDGQNGLAGEAGQDGLAGESGQNGLAGEAGQDGQNGLAGEAGQNGQNGIDGVNGKDVKPTPAYLESSPIPVSTPSSLLAADQLITNITPNTSTLPLNQSASEKIDTPPCPACERCPEPAFECKKVPNYRSPSIDNYMPIPVLNSFSKF